MNLFHWLTAPEHKYLVTFTDQFGRRWQLHATSRHAARQLAHDYRLQNCRDVAIVELDRDADLMGV